MLTPTKQLAKDVFSVFGLDIQKKRPPRPSEAGKDSFAHQVKLVGSAANVIFDIGANTGQTAERYRALFPEAAIYCFEPFPDFMRRSLEHLTRTPT